MWAHDDVDGNLEGLKFFAIFDGKDIFPGS
jgi:hypothetical protein